MKFDQKIAIITGGDQGIGEAVAIRLASAGATVVINYHQNAEAAGNVVAELA